MKLVFAALFILFVPLVVISTMGMMLPETHVAVASAAFHHSQEEVWKVISGPPDWRPDVTRFERLPERDGHPMWREYSSDGKSIAYELVTSEPPRKMMTRIAEKDLPYRGTWIYDLDPEGKGSRLTITEAGSIHNPIFRFVSHYVMGQTATIDAYLRNLSRKLGDDKPAK